MSSPVLEISGLEVTFPGLTQDTKVLRRVDMRIGAGEVLGLVGESGSGKSMTALACLGMVPPPAKTTGSIKVQGREVVGRSDRQLRALRGGEAAIIFQNPMRSLNPFFSVGWQMIEIIRLHRACGRVDARAVAIEELRSVQIPDPAIVLGKYPHQLSGGQIQRVMIAMALACRPKLLIADEPTTALDVTVQAQIISLLRELADEKDLTVLFITHDLGVVSQLCDRVAVMYAGRIVESGSITDVIDNPLHPYTAKLMNTVPTVGHGKRELQSIPGQVPDPALAPSGCAFHPRCEYAVQSCTQTVPVPVTLGGGREVACHRIGIVNSIEMEAS